MAQVGLIISCERNKENKTKGGSIQSSSEQCAKVYSLMCHVFVASTPPHREEGSELQFAAGVQLLNWY